MPARFSACATLTALPVSEPRAVRPAQAQGFDMPTATVWETGELCDFCTNAEFGLGFVPQEALLVPPQQNHFDALAFAQLSSQAEVSDEVAYDADGAALRARLDRVFALS